MASQPPVQFPQTPEAELMQLREENELLKAENGRLRSYLNNIEKLTQRVLALRAHRDKLLWLALGAGILIYGSIPGTPLNRVLVDAWNALHPPHAHAQHVQPPIYDAVFPSPGSPLPSAVPSASMPTPAASPPSSLVIISKVAPSPTPSPRPSCNGNHQPSDPVCPPMGHRPSPSPPT